MSNKIIVDSCRFCPLKIIDHLLSSGTRVDICTHNMSKGMIIRNLSIIHPDCPLEENKRDCTCHD